MEITLIMTFNERATAEQVAAGIREAADRAAGQIEQGILRHPLPVDDYILLARDEGEMTEAAVTRAE